MNNQNKDILISFLKAILGESDEKIESVEFEEKAKKLVDIFELPLIYGTFLKTLDTKLMNLFRNIS